MSDNVIQFPAREKQEVPDDEIIVAVTIKANSACTVWTSDRLQSREQWHWAVRQLACSLKQLIDMSEDPDGY